MAARTAPGGGRLSVLRVVLDPNVLISAAISRGVPYRILLAWHFRAFEMVVSYELLYELEAVLLRPWFRRKLTRADVIEYVMWLSGDATLMPQGDVTYYSGDPDDDYLLALARSSDADYLVSGDSDLISLEVEETGVKVLTPRAFYEVLVAEAYRG